MLSEKILDTGVDYSALEKFISIFQKLDLSGYVTRLFLKKGRHSIENGEVFKALLVAATISEKVSFSTFEKDFEKFEKDYFSKILKDPYETFDFISDFLNSRPRGISDDLIGRFLERVYLFGCDEFFHIISQKLGVVNKSENNSCDISPNVSLEGTPAEQSYLFLPASYYDLHDLENLGDWVVRLPRELVAVNMEKIDPKSNSILDCGGYKVEHKGRLVRWIVDEKSKDGRFLDTEKIFSDEFEMAKKSLEVVKFGNSKKKEPLSYESKESIFDALKIWMKNFPHCKLNDEFKEGGKIDEFFEGCVETRKLVKKAGRPNMGSIVRYIVKASPTKVKAKTSFELRIPYLVLATNDMETEAGEILRRYKEVSPLFRKIIKKRPKKEADTSVANGDTLKAVSEPAPVPAPEPVPEPAPEPVPVRAFGLVDRKPDKAITVTNLAKKEAYACVLAVCDLIKTFSVENDSKKDSVTGS